MDTIATVGRQPLPDKRHAPSLYARDWPRVVAFVTDFVIVYLLAFMLEAVLMPLLVWAAVEGNGEARFMLADSSGSAYFVFMVVAWLYYALWESSDWQATPGKRWQRIVVTDRYGADIGFGRASGRVFGMWLSALPWCLGFLMVDLTPRKQALHDWIAGCCVLTRAGLDAFQRVEFDATAVPGSPRAGAVVPSRPNS